MAESQNIEYKESWRDEYLKWICGFANANDQQAEIRNKMLGFIFQQYNLIPKLNVLENVELPLDRKSVV